MLTEQKWIQKLIIDCAGYSNSQSQNQRLQIYLVISQNKNNKVLNSKRFPQFLGLSFETLLS